MKLVILSNPLAPTPAAVSINALLNEEADPAAASYDLPPLNTPTNSFFHRVSESRSARNNAMLVMRASNGVVVALASKTHR